LLNKELRITGYTRTGKFLRVISHWITCFTSFAPRPTNFFGFSFATVLSRRNGYRVNIVTNFNKLITTIHRWQWEVIGYQILFPVLTFVPQRQSLLDKKSSLLVFHLVSTDISPALSIIWFILFLILSSSNPIYTN